jgi:hypothetical protein
MSPISATLDREQLPDLAGFLKLASSPRQDDRLQRPRFGIEGNLRWLDRFAGRALQEDLSGASVARHAHRSGTACLVEKRGTTRRFGVCH